MKTSIQPSVPTVPFSSFCVIRILYHLPFLTLYFLSAKSFPFIPIANSNLFWWIFTEGTLVPTPQQPRPTSLLDSMNWISLSQSSFPLMEFNLTSRETEKIGPHFGKVVRSFFVLKVPKNPINIWYYYLLNVYLM